MQSGPKLFYFAGPSWTYPFCFLRSPSKLFELNIDVYLKRIKNDHVFNIYWQNPYGQQEHPGAILSKKSIFPYYHKELKFRQPKIQT